MIQVGKKFIKSFLWNFMGRNAMIIIGVLTSIVVARGLGPQNYGYYVTIIGIVMLIPFFISFGFENIINIHIPQFLVKNEKNKIAFLVRSLAKIRTIVALIAGVILFFTAHYLAKALGHPSLAFYLRFAVPLIFFNELVRLVVAIFPSVLNMKPHAIFSTITSFFTLVLSFVVIRAGFGISGLLGVAIFIALLSVVYYLFMARDLIFLQPERIVLKPLLTAGIVIWGASLFGMALGSQIDIVILNLFRVPIEKVGFYGLAFNLKTKMAFLTMGIGGLAQSVFGMTFSQNGEKKLAKAWQVIVKFGILFVLPIAIFCFVYANEVISLLYSSAYLPVVDLFRLYLVLTFITIFVGQSFNGPVLFVLGKEKINFYLQAFVGVCNIILDVIFIPILGVYGAVLATAISVGLFAYVGMGIVRHHIGIIPPVGFFIKVFSVCTLASFSYLLFRPVGFFSLALAAMVYFITMIILFYIFKLFTAEEKAMVKNIDPRLYALAEKF